MPEKDIEDKAKRRTKKDKSKEKYEKYGKYTTQHVRNSVLVEKIMAKAQKK
jgi:hypothetical protein